jgi:hypothetical protein
MFVKLLGLTLSIMVLGCLLMGCSEDTQRVTSRGTTIVANPLATDIDNANGETGVFPYDTYLLWDTAVVDEGSGTGTTTDPMDRFDTGHDSGKPIDRESDTH